MQYRGKPMSVHFTVRSIFNLTTGSAMCLHFDLLADSKLKFLSSKYNTDGLDSPSPPEHYEEMVEPIFDYQFRLILIGDSTVGKSSLLKYFTDGKFSEMCDPTVGVDFFARLIEVKHGIRVKLQLWDTAGQERFRSITRSYYRNSVGVLIVFDITKRQSFENITSWLAEAKFHIEPHQAVYMIVGHKSDCDSERQVTFREATQFAHLNGLKYIETSAKTGQNVEEAFLVLAKDINRLLEEGRVKIEEGWDGIKPGFNRSEERPPVHIDEEESEGSKCC